MINPNAPRSLVALQMLNEMEKAKSWCGETHLQKSLFLLGALGGVFIEYPFIIYKHGPYSFDLHDDVSWLESAYLVSRAHTPPYGAKLSVTDSGRVYLDRMKEWLDPIAKRMEIIAKEFSVMTVAELERYSTAAYVRVMFPELTKSQMVEKLVEIKPHINQDAAVNSFERIADLEVVST